MADVFISYARSTATCARALAAIIEANGNSVWYDARLPAHRWYADVIQEQLDAAKAVLIIWSAEAVRSQWVRSEADRARHNGTLIQLRIDDCAPPMPFDQIQCPSLAEWSGDRSDPSLHVILDSLSALLCRDMSDEVQLQHQSPAVATARPPEAQLLLEAAMKSLQAGQADELVQAIPLLIEATRIAPADGEIWGLLAVVYAARRRAVTAADRAAYETRARSAIETALRLDPQEVRARCAAVILMPAYRNWQNRESAARQILSKRPETPLAQFSLAVTLANTGQWSEAADIVGRISRTRFLLPAVEQFTVLALWSAGQIVQAELAGERAARRFPVYTGLWEARVALLTHTGRATDAMSMLDDAVNRPPGCTAAKLESARFTASALAGRRPAEEALAINEAMLGSGEIEPLTVAQRCAALGFTDASFSVLEGYYSRRGRWAKCAPASDEDISTSELFMPQLKNVWSDERFGVLVDQIGLEAHWRQTGKVADFAIRNASAISRGETAIGAAGYCPA